MKIEALKEKARRHEQKEEWQKALDLYREAIRKHDEDEPPDITLYNRVGDIQTRLGQVDGAVESYETAIDLYLEAELPNNAIAVCKKVLRNLPDRRVFFLRMGQIRGAQGFLTDARQNFLTYAEEATQAGDMNGALDALIEFVELAPEDLEIRLGLASQLETHDRIEEALPQYLEAYRQMILQERQEEADGLAEKIGSLDPDAVLPDTDTIFASVGGGEEEVREVADGLAGLELGSGIPGAMTEPPEIEADIGEIEVAEEETEELEETALEEVLQGAESHEALESAFEEIGHGEEEEEPEEHFPTPEVDEEDEALPTFGFSEEGPHDEEAPDALPLMGFGEEDEEEEGEPLPTLSFEDEDEEESASLPTFGFDETEVEEAEGTGQDEAQEPILGAADFGEADYGDRETKEYVEEVEAIPELEVELEDFESGEGKEEEESAWEGALEDSAFEADLAEEVAEAPVAEAPPSHQEAAEAGNLDLAMELVRAQIGAQPDDVGLHQRMVEYAFRKADHSVLIPAYLELAGVLVRTGAPTKARSVYQQVLSLSPGHEGAHAGLAELEGAPAGKKPTQVASSEEYVDLGSMILGKETPKTTRWQVTADAPSGDDQADFAKMLSQFKQKVSEHVDADDVSAHHDLGTAYMEMGLLDEAISEFQLALRAAPDHLPTHEVMGRCWLEMEKPDMAVRALNRALAAPFDVEDELIGIYYLMGRAQEELGHKSEAAEFYDKVFSLDINFEDVTERLRYLRED